MIFELQVERSRRVYFSPLPAFVLVLYSVSSTAANTNSTSSNASDTTPNGSAPQPFSCEWKDLEFPITYGPGIASSLCVLIGGFLVILGKDKIFPMSTCVATFYRQYHDHTRLVGFATINFFRCFQIFA